MDKRQIIENIDVELAEVIAKHVNKFKRLLDDFKVLEKEMDEYWYDMKLADHIYNFNDVLDTVINCGDAATEDEMLKEVNRYRLHVDKSSGRLIIKYIDIFRDICDCQRRNDIVESLFFESEQARMKKLVNYLKNKQKVKDIKQAYYLFGYLNFLDFEKVTIDPSIADLVDHEGYLSVKEAGYGPYTLFDYTDGFIERKDDATDLNYTSFKSNFLVPGVLASQLKTPPLSFENHQGFYEQDVEYPDIIYLSNLNFDLDLLPNYMNINETLFQIYPALAYEVKFNELMEKYRDVKTQVGELYHRLNILNSSHTYGDPEKDSAIKDILKEINDLMIKVSLDILKECQCAEESVISGAILDEMHLALKNNKDN